MDNNQYMFIFTHLISPVYSGQIYPSDCWSPRMCENFQGRTGSGGFDDWTIERFQLTQIQTETNRTWLATAYLASLRKYGEFCFFVVWACNQCLPLNTHMILYAKSSSLYGYSKNSRSSKLKTWIDPTHIHQETTKENIKTRNSFTEESFVGKLPWVLFSWPWRKLHWWSMSSTPCHSVEMKIRFCHLKRWCSSRGTKWSSQWSSVTWIFLRETDELNN